MLSCRKALQQRVNLELATGALDEVALLMGDGMTRMATRPVGMGDITSLVP